MKYRVNPDTALYAQFVALFALIREYDAQALALMEILGATDFTFDSMYLAGGVTGFSFSTPPDNWKAVGYHYSHVLKVYAHYYFPKSHKVNATVLATIAALPAVKIEVINELVGFQRQRKGLTEFAGIGYQMMDTYLLIEISEEARYTPHPDMTEILVSEYMALKAEPATT